MKVLVSLSSQLSLNDRVAWLNDEGTYNVGTVTHYRTNNCVSVDFDAGFKIPSIQEEKLVKLPIKTKKTKKDLSKEQVTSLLSA